ncbi:MAG: hypothetical protein J6X03_02380 [Bacilli bacterium]|nr:hypothetical protein [Bacilli bacterium]
MKNTKTGKTAGNVIDKGKNLLKRGLKRGSIKVLGKDTTKAIGKVAKVGGKLAGPLAAAALMY